MTLEEMKELIAMMKKEFDMVRLVEPIRQQVVDCEDLKATGEVCSDVWHRCTRCENCSSNRALHNRNKAFKIEMVDDKAVLVISRYVEVEGRPMVIEIINDATDDFLLDSDREDTLGRIIKSYNDKIMTDPLTGVYNRRFLDENFVPSLDCCYDADVPINVAIMDIDDFKRINDSYGHQAGDVLLRDIAGFWKLHFDVRDKMSERFVVRFGGDEFLIVACNVSFADFKLMMKQFYMEMRKVCYFTEAIHIPFEISFGVASSVEQEGDSVPWSEVLRRADERMYQRKEAKTQEQSGLQAQS
jgi:diguanylate cyclase (GGDEF)-like protein